LGAHLIRPLQLVGLVLAVRVARFQQRSALGPVVERIALAAPLLDDAGAAFEHRQIVERVMLPHPGRDRALVGTVDGAHQLPRQHIGDARDRQRSRQLDGQPVQHLQLAAVAIVRSEAAHADTLYVFLPARFASSSERSARPITSSGSRSVLCETAIPSEAPTPAAEAIEASSLRAISSTSSPIAGRIRANSSPPSRPATSLSRDPSRGAS